MNENASKTYKFEYDKTKSLEEQKLNKKTKGIIGYIYKKYLCNEIEKEDYNKYISDILNEIEEEKRKKYGTEITFKNKNRNSDNIEEKRLLEKKEKNIFGYIIKYIKNILKIR